VLKKKLNEMISASFDDYPGKALNEAKKYLQRLTIVSLLESGMSVSAVSSYTSCSIDTVKRWKDRPEVDDLPRPGRPLIYGDKQQLKLIGFYCQSQPFQGYGRWTLRMAELFLKKKPEELGFSASKSTISRVLQSHNLKPHRSKYFLHISDPDFFPKMEHIIDLYLNPPENLFSFDESPGIQVLQRLVPDLQTEQTKVRLEEFEYIRNGTIDLFACLEVSSGKVFSECSSCHNTDSLINFLEKHILTIPENEPIHYILDNLNTHSNYKVCTLIAEYCKITCPPKEELSTMKKRREWLAGKGKRIVFHFTPVHGSWLNMIEIWFGIVANKCLKESFASPDDLHEAINSFADTWNTLMAHPFNWQYKGEGLQEKTVQKFIKTLCSEKIADIEIRVLRKQLQLMKNIFIDYRKSVKEKYWSKLKDVISLKGAELREIINNEPGPRRKEDALISLKELESIFLDKEELEQNYAA
jgi:transposase